MTETQDILLTVLHAVTWTEHRPQAHVHAESKPDKHTPRSWASMSHPCTMYTRMHTHNSHLHRPVTQALCTHPHMYTPCIHTQLHSLTHTARACTPTSPTSLILPSPTESPPTLQSPKPLTFPLAFLPCHTPLAALKGSPRGRLPKQVEEQSWRESRGMGRGGWGGGQNSGLGMGTSISRSCCARPHWEPASRMASPEPAKPDSTWPTQATSPAAALLSVITSRKA